MVSTVPFLLCGNRFVRIVPLRGILAFDVLGNPIYDFVATYSNRPDYNGAATITLTTPRPISRASSMAASPATRRQPVSGRRSQELCVPLRALRINPIAVLRLD